MNRRGLIAFVALAAPVAVLSALRHPLDSDEGVILNGAWNLLFDQAPYLDAFEYIAPGSFYGVYGAWLLAAPTYLVARVFAIVAALGASVAVIATARSLNAGARGYLSAATYFAALNVGPVINHNILFLLPASWALFFAVRTATTGHARDAIAGGLLCGLATLVLQHKGFALAGAIGLSLLWTGVMAGDWRRRMYAVAAFLTAALIPLLWLLRWPLATLFDQLIVFPLHRYAEVQQVSRMGLLAVAALSGWLFWHLWRATAGARAAMPTLLLVQIAMLIGALQRPDPLHLAVALFPLAAAFAVFARTYLAARVDAVGQARVRPSFVIGAALATLLCAGVAGTFVLTSMTASSLSQTRQALIAAIDTHCADDALLYAGPFLPGLYFESRRHNVTRYAILIERFNTAAQFAEAAQALRARPPGCAVVNYAMVERFGHRADNPVDAFVREHYRPVARIGESQLMKKR